MGARVINSVLLLCVGVLFGFIGTVAQQSTVTVGSIRLPWGIIVALIAIGTLMVGVRLVTADRLPALMVSLGVVAIIALLSFKSAGGSVLIPDNILGKIWVIAPIVIAAVVIAWPRVNRASVDA